MLCQKDADGNPVHVRFPAFYEKGEMAEHTKHVRDPDFRFYWNPEWFNENWYFDAFTIEPEKMIAHRSGLWERGKHKPIVESLIANASPGSLPHVQVRADDAAAAKLCCVRIAHADLVQHLWSRSSNGTAQQPHAVKHPTRVQVYLMMHPEHGTRALYLWYGAKGGGKNKAAAGQMYDGFKFWHDDLEQHDIQWLHDNKYCNQQEGLKNCKKCAPERYKSMEQPVTADSKVDPQCWMVCAYFDDVLRLSFFTTVFAASSQVSSFCSMHTSTA